MTKVVNLGVLDTGDHEETVNTGADVADEERITGFGDKDVFSTTFGALLKVGFESNLGGGV